MEGGWNYEKSSYMNQQIRKCKLDFPYYLINEYVKLKLWTYQKDQCKPENLENVLTTVTTSANMSNSLIYYATIENYGMGLGWGDLPPTLESITIYFTPVGMDGDPVMILDDNVDLAKYSVAKGFITSVFINTLDDCKNQAYAGCSIPVSLGKMMDEKIPLSKILPYLLDFSISRRKIDWNNDEDVKIAKAITNRVSTLYPQLVSEIDELDNEIYRITRCKEIRSQGTTNLLTRYGDIEKLKIQLEKLAMGKQREKLVKEKEQIDQQIAILRAKAEEIRKQLAQ